MATVDNLKNLEILNLFIATYVRNALVSSVVTNYTKLLFHENKEKFATNPANTLTYSALDAMHDRAVVMIAGYLKDESKALGVSDDIRHRADLLAHRDVMSHPTVVEWRNPKIQEFVDQKRQWYDFKPALIWNMQTHINAQLRAASLKTHNETLVAYPEMVTLCRTVLLYSIRPEHWGMIPDEAVLTKHMQDFLGKYVEFISKHPGVGRSSADVGSGEQGADGGNAETRRT